MKKSAEKREVKEVPCEAVGWQPLGGGGEAGRQGEVQKRKWGVAPTKQVG